MHALLLSHLKHMGVAPMFLTANVDCLSDGMRRRVMEILSRRRGLFLCGPPGVGKTFIAVAIVQQALVALYNRTASYRTMRYDHINDMLLTIRKAFQDGSQYSEEDLISTYSEPELLVIDDLGAQKSTDWSVQTLDTIIDRRYRQSPEKVTVITSNFTLAELGSRISERVASRIAGMCDVVEIRGKDRRMEAL